MQDSILIPWNTWGWTKILIISYKLSYFFCIHHLLNFRNKTEKDRTRSQNKSKSKQNHKGKFQTDHNYKYTCAHKCQGRGAKSLPRKSCFTIKYHNICKPTLMNGINQHFLYNDLKKAHPYTKVKFTVRPSIIFSEKKNFTMTFLPTIFNCM